MSSILAPHHGSANYASSPKNDSYSLVFHLLAGTMKEAW
jgi:hypothetical protein